MTATSFNSPEVTGDTRTFMRDCRFVSLLGVGGFSRVALVQQVTTGAVFAMKIMKKSAKKAKSIATTERRVLSLAARHPFLVSLHSAFQTPDYLCFVMEYINGGTLMNHIRQCGKFDESQARFYAAEVLLAVGFLHDNGIIHR